MKRFCTIGWVLTGLVAAALYSDRPELVGDPDYVWGLASRDLLMPGLTGLMLACLLAALMSSVDAYMIVSSALVVRNLYVPFVNPAAGEAQCVRVARFTGAIVVIGSVTVALLMNNVLEQLKVTWYVPMIFAAPFWIGMFWRRATVAAAWTTIAASTLLIFVLPALLPLAAPDLRTSDKLVAVTDVIETTTTRSAAPSDIARRSARIERWREQQQEALAIEKEAERSAKLTLLGSAPEPLALGASIKEVQTEGGVAIYWSGGVQAVDDHGNELAEVVPLSLAEAEELDTNATRRTLRYADGTRLTGQGNLKVDFLIYDLVGLDLAAMDQATLQSLDLPMKMIVPFVLMIFVSFFTPRNSRESLDRFYVKMKTPVAATPAEDQAELAESYRNPHRFDRKRLLDCFGLEIQRPSAVDIGGFLGCFAICFAIIGLAVWISGIGG